MASSTADQLSSDECSESGRGKVVSYRSLGDCYRVVGNELLKWYGHRDLYSRRWPRAAADEFRVGVTCVSVEILETYLDDLLDPYVSDDRLHIARAPWRVSPYGVMAAASASVGISTLYAVYAEASISWCFVIGALIGVALAGIWQITPGARLTRRMSFAKLLSQEIAHRRGGSDSGDANHVLSLVRFWAPESGRSTPLSTSRYVH